MALSVPSRKRTLTNLGSMRTLFPSRPDNSRVESCPPRFDARSKSTHRCRASSAHRRICGVSRHRLSRRHLAVSTSIRLAEGMALIIHRVLPKKLTRYPVARDNIRQAFGTDTPTGRSTTSFGGCGCTCSGSSSKLCRSAANSGLYNCADVVQFKGRDENVRLFCSGRPVIILSGHFGNWEIAIGTFGMFGFPLGVVARDLDNPYLHAWFETFRRQTGHS